MRYAGITYNDLVNSDGVALTFFCQGCPHHCPFCFNKETWDFEGGEELTEEIVNQAFKVVKNFSFGYDNLVLLGGEPFANINECNIFVDKWKELFPKKKIWCYTGFNWNDLLIDKDKYKLLQKINVVITGKFINELKNPKLAFRGSSNQYIIDVQKSLKQGMPITIKKYMELER